MPFIWPILFLAAGAFVLLMSLYLAPAIYVLGRGIANGHGFGDSFVAAGIVFGLATWCTNWGWPTWGVLLFILGLTAVFAAAMGPRAQIREAKAAPR